jgi:D-tyrosyl-tRNA(Tyr) deacylase
VAGETVGAIERGLVAFVGAMEGDDEEQARYVVDKIVNLRVFEDDAGRMSRALPEVGGGLLVISQFTVAGDVRRGRRPSFDDAMAPDLARALLERFVELARARDVPVATGRFAADMRVLVDNDGPVTILIDSRRVF